MDIEGLPKDVDLRFDRPRKDDEPFVSPVPMPTFPKENTPLDVFHKQSTGRELTLEEGFKIIGTIDDRRKLLAFHEMLCRRAMAIMDKKNSDYGARTDPFRNFHGFGAFGILVRKSDKMARLQTFLEKLSRGENMAVI